MRRATLALGLVLCAASAAHAARIDQIVLRNGDHLTGEVLQLRQGKLQVKTDDAGTISIEWDEIAAVTTAAPYDIIKQDGARLFGRLRPGAAGTLTVMADDGSTTTLAMADVASFAQIKATFLQRLDGSFDLGGSYTQSSGVAQFTLDTQVKYRRPADQYAASLSTSLTRQPEVEETFRYALNVGYTRYGHDHWLLTSFGLFESNEDLGFTFRGTGALGVGRYLVRTRRTEFLTSGGLAVGRESPVGESTATNVDALAAAEWSFFTYDYPTTRLDLTVLVFPSLDDPGRVRLNANAKFKRELLKDFFVSVSGYDALDTRPKTAAATAQNDVGGALSFGWTF